jgi:SAM-dependent methyltransferase
MKLLIQAKRMLRRRAKIAFLAQLKANCSILDVGCGNNSPYLVKSVLPMCKYTGVDIGDYNQKKPNLADSYIITTPENFASSISDLGQQFDAVISSHNLEHCNDRVATLLAIFKVLKPGGTLYLSFPSERASLFPKRDGTLNYFDDNTHQGLPPNFFEVTNLIKSSNFSIDFCAKNYQPSLLWLIGFLIEPISQIKNTVFLGTWEFYGFETIIWARKNS